jgi:hypothetical protein
MEPRDNENCSEENQEDQDPNPPQPPNVNTQIDEGLVILSVDFNLVQYLLQTNIQ